MFAVQGTDCTADVTLDPAGEQLHIARMHIRCFFPIRSTVNTLIFETARVEVMHSCEGRSTDYDRTGVGPRRVVQVQHLATIHHSSLTPSAV